MSYHFSRLDPSRRNPDAIDDMAFKHPTHVSTSHHNLIDERETNVHSVLCPYANEVLQSSPSEQKEQENRIIDGDVVSHLPIMSSSSSSSSLSIPPSLATKKNGLIVDQRTEDPRTRPIIVGQETLIEIDRGQGGLGLSVVGGSDTQLVSDRYLTDAWSDRTGDRVISESGDYS